MTLHPTLCQTKPFAGLQYEIKTKGECALDKVSLVEIWLVRDVLGPLSNSEDKLNSQSLYWEHPPEWLLFP